MKCATLQTSYALKTLKPALDFIINEDEITMNKNDLADIIAGAANISKAEANSALEAFINTVQNTLKEGGKISITGFGSFETGKRAARTGRNPQTGKMIEIPAAIVAKFKPGKALKDAVNSK